jgi:hypothetical protein
MNRQRKYFSLIVIIAVALFSSIDARAQTTPHIFIQPQHTYIEAPATCTLHLVVDECIDSLSCFECIVTFDTSLVSLESIEEGQLYTEAAFSTFFRWEHSAPDTGSVMDCVLGYQSYILPPGELARFVFQAKETGVCPVKITRMRLWDIDREQLPVEVDSFAYIHNTIATGVHTIGYPKARLRCYPNPFNPCTSLILNIPYVHGEAIEADISVSIYTPAGRLVRTIHRGAAQSGTNEFTWDGRDWRGTGAPSGVYFAAVIMNGETFVRKLILLR